MSHPKEDFETYNKRRIAHLSSPAYIARMKRAQANLRKYGFPDDWRKPTDREKK